MLFISRDVVAVAIEQRGDYGQIVPVPAIYLPVMDVSHIQAYDYRHARAVFARLEELRMHLDRNVEHLFAGVESFPNLLFRRLRWIVEALGSVITAPGL